MTKILAVLIAVACGAGVVALIVHTWRRVNVGMQDALSLAAKVAVPHPRSARDWPELRIDAVLVSPQDQHESLVEVTWPGRPGNHATLVVHVDDRDHHELELLQSWQVEEASVLPVALSPTEVELRRRGTLTRVHATVLAETYREGP